MADVLPLRPSVSHISFFDASATYGGPRRNSYSHSDLRSPSLSSSQASSISSTRSTPASSLSLDHDRDWDSEDDDDDNSDGLSFPAYRSADRNYRYRASVDSDDNECISPTTVRPPSSPTPSPADGPAPDTPLSTPDPPPVSEDDSAVRLEPKHHVDYLSYEWKEEDIWSSWRHIVEHRRLYGERSRLENASWRTWAKSQFKLKTVSPETLNWLKDVDVTWLYGPLQPASNRLSVFQQNSEPVSRLSKTNSFLSLNKKPILKKRTMSEVMLQKSLSSSSLVQQAAASVQAQQTAVSLERRRPRPIIGRATSDFVSSSIPSRTTSREPTDYFSSHSTSGLQTPDLSEKKHIRFDDKVEQCIAVECKDADDDDEDDCNHNPWAKYRDEDSSSDEGVVMMKRQRKRRPLSRTNSKSSFSGESKIIAKLPSTTLKYRTDSPDVTEQHQSHSLGFWRSSRLSPSPSQETLRPSNPSTNFLLPSDDDDEEEDDLTFNPSRAYEVKRASTPTPSDPYSGRPGTPIASSSSSSEGGGLRRTASGMFMPFEDREDDASQPGILGKVVDTVNTARDIAHVIWNVGWRN